MFTNELKVEITNKLMRVCKRSGELSTNPFIYKKEYVDKHELGSLISEVKSVTSHMLTSRLDERIYVILNDITEPVKCKTCSNSVKFKRFLLGYSEYCSVRCRANDCDWQEKRAVTFYNKTGVRHPSQLEVERQKRSKAAKDRKFWSNSNSVENIEKRRKTIDRLYGVGFNTGWTESAINSRIDNGHMIPVEIRDEFNEYRRAVELVTTKQPHHLLPNSEFRGVLGKDDNAHHLDHIVSTYDGFLYDIDPIIIGNICNLQYIPGRENITKGNKSHMTIEQLLEKYYGTDCKRV